MTNHEHDSRTTNGLVDIDEIDLTNNTSFSSDDLIEVIKAATTFERPAPRSMVTNVLTSPRARDIPGALPEHVFEPKEQADIQGNIIPGFNKTILRTVLSEG